MVFTSTARTRGLDLNLFALDLSLVQVLHGFFRVTYIVELDEFVVFLVGGFTYLFDLSILPECCLQLVIGR